MRTVINKKILEIYHNYDGDIDGLLRTGRISDLEALGSEVDNIWADVTGFIQNIELIQKGLVSQEYANKSIEEIKSNCDQAAFDELTKNISQLFPV